MKQKRGLITVIIILLALLTAYNIFRYPAMFRRLPDRSLGEAETEQLKDEIAAKEGKRVLAAYFSYSGTTRRAAEALSSQTGADLYEIAPKEAYSNVYMQSNMEIRRNSRPELAGTVENMEDYDIVFVGYPVWFHATPAPVNTFLESYDFSGKTIVLFATSGGSGFGKTVKNLQGSVSPSAVIKEGKILNGRQDAAQLKAWIDSLGV